MSLYSFQTLNIKYYLKIIGLNSQLAGLDIMGCVVDSGIAALVEKQYIHHKNRYFYNRIFSLLCLCIFEISNIILNNSLFWKLQNNITEYLIEHPNINCDSELCGSLHSSSLLSSTAQSNSQQLVTVSANTSPSYSLCVYFDAPNKP